jgi:RNA polymerase sigma-70 factor (ECF subfamily)
MDMPEQAISELALSKVVDAELVRLAREGSASALRLIVRRHNQRLYRVARAMVRDDAAAEDVMQESYLSAFSHLASFRADASLATWLTRIVVNKAINHRRRESVMVPLEAVDEVAWADASAGVMPHLGPEFDPERIAARSQVRDLLERAIDNLPEPFRVVFVMRMVEQLSVRETACSLGIPEETVKTRLHRAKKLMREQLHTALASALTDTFPFQDPRCATFTDALLARLADGSKPVGRSRQHRCSKPRPSTTPWRRP